MQVDVSAQVSKVTIKPPKAVQGVRVGPSLVQVVLEIEGTEQVAKLAELVNQEVDVILSSSQMSFDDVTEAARKALSDTNGVKTTISYARTLGE